MVTVGKIVTRVPQTIGMPTERNRMVLERRPQRGKVVYVHPKGRFHVVEFENLMGDKIRETFDGVED